MYKGMYRIDMVKNVISKVGVGLISRKDIKSWESAQQYTLDIALTNAA